MKKILLYIIPDILDRNKIPAGINTADGGLIKPGIFNSELIYFVSQIHYDWIFPKMYAVIHHRGSGTTHLGIKYGCATMIIPHIVDQLVWDKMISDLGAGPEGIKINRINNKSFKDKSEKIGSRMKKEDFKYELCKTIIE